MVGQSLPRGFPRKAPVSQQLKWARQHRGLSHDKLAAAAGTSRQHLIKLEKNLHVPRPALMGRIAEALDVPYEAFSMPADDDEDSLEAALMVAVSRFARDLAGVVRAA